MAEYRQLYPYDHDYASLEHLIFAITCALHANRRASMDDKARPSQTRMLRRDIRRYMQQLERLSLVGTREIERWAAMGGLGGQRSPICFLVHRWTSQLNP